MRWKGRVILQLGARSRLHACTAKGVHSCTVQKRHVPEHRRRRFSTFYGGEACEGEPCSGTAGCLGALAVSHWEWSVGYCGSIVLFVVESQSPLRLDTSAPWRRCPFSLESGPLALAKLQRYLALYARLAAYLRSPVEEDVAGPRRIERHRNIPRIFAESAGRFGRLS